MIKILQINKILIYKIIKFKLFKKKSKLIKIVKTNNFIFFNKILKNKVKKMLKGLVNLFKCCKPQNRSSTKNELETVNYQESAKNTNEDQKKNFNKCPTDKSLTTKCTNFMNNCPTINSDKVKSPEPEVPRKKPTSPYINFPFEARNVNNEKNYVFKPNKEEIKFESGDFSVEGIKSDNNNNNNKDFEENKENNKEFVLDSNREIDNFNPYYVGDCNENYAASDKNLVEIIKKNGYDLDKQDDEFITEGNKNVKGNKEDEFDKIIVPDKYIREDEKNFLIWVSYLFLRLIEIHLNYFSFTFFIK